ncbi:MAG: patatin-like phospholipase family protein [Chloroflexi bacterium]|nr:patatin-like phospholipase family protein [Chloroflexota bacterium]
MTLTQEQTVTEKAPPSFLNQPPTFPSPTKKTPRKKVGLALSGGVARGPVHVGVISALEQAGIPIDCIAGTSAGAIVGAAYCAGLEIPQLRTLAANSGWRNMINLTRSRHGLFSFSKMEWMITEMVGNLDVCDLSIPFTAVVTDMVIGERVYLRQGSLATAVRASCSVPGVITPVEIDGSYYCDGGISDNIPVDAVREMGADYIIAVDLFVPHYRPGLGFLGASLAALELLIRHAGGGAKEADCVIEPAIAGHNYFNFSRRKSQEYMRLGEAAAESMIPTIKAALAVEKTT